jgi:ferredoxin-NADP reductase
VAGTAVLGRLTWLVAEVTATATETPRVRTLVLDADGWSGHRAGQHLDVRLTAEDGYQAERSYSIASAPGEPLAITVELLEDGEVSPYLVDEVRDGDRFEIRGPIGGYFVWEPDDPQPLLLVGGGSGVVPLMAMIRHREAAGGTAPTRLLYSSRTLEDVIYRVELDELAARMDGFEVFHTLTRSQPDGWTGYGRRIDAEILRDVAWPAAGAPQVFVCGSTRFVDVAADGLIALGYDPRTIKTERFGATGN